MASASNKTTVFVTFSTDGVRIATPFHTMLRDYMRSSGYVWSSVEKTWRKPIDIATDRTRYITAVDHARYGSDLHALAQGLNFAVQISVLDPHSGSLVFVPETLSADPGSFVDHVMTKLGSYASADERAALAVGSKVRIPANTAVAAIPGANAHLSAPPDQGQGRYARKAAGAMTGSLPQRDPRAAATLADAAQQASDTATVLPMPGADPRLDAELIGALPLHAFERRVLALHLGDNHHVVALSPVDKDGVRLFRHQLEVLADFDARYGRRMIVAHEPGMGKTLTAILVANVYVSSGRVVVVCPEHLRRMWQREFRRYGRGAHVYGLEKMAAKQWSESSADVLILGYASIIKETMEKLCDGPLAAEMLIVDESHYCGNKDAQRTKRAMQWAHRVQSVLCLSGTPSASRIINLWPTLRMIDPSPNLPDYFKFGLRYCNGKQGKFGWDFSGASNLTELAEKTRGAMHRRRKEDALDLPAKRRIVVSVPIDEAVRLSLQARVQKAMSGTQGITSHHSRVMGALSGIHSDLWSAKRDSVIAWCLDFLRSGRKLVVFAVHKQAVADIHAALCKEMPDYGFAKVDGDTNDALRQTAVAAFQHNPGTRAIVATLGTLSTGVTLTAASDIAFAELNWVPADVAQAEDRIHRIGQKNACTIYQLVCEGTLDEMMANSLVRKMDQLSEALDTASPATEAYASRQAQVEVEGLVDVAEQLDATGELREAG